LLQDLCIKIIVLSRGGGGRGVEGPVRASKGGRGGALRVDQARNSGTAHLYFQYRNIFPYTNIFAWLIFQVIFRTLNPIPFNHSFINDSETLAMNTKIDTAAGCDDGEG